MEHIELESSTLTALRTHGRVVYKDEIIKMPAIDKCEIITINRADGKEHRWSGEGIATYVVVHTMTDGTKLVAPFDFAF